MQLYTKILIGMGLGVILGFLIGPNSALLPDTGVALSPGARVVTQQGGSEQVPLSTGIEQALILEESPASADGPNWLKIEWTLSAGDVLRMKSASIPAAEEAEVGSTHTGWIAEVTPEVRRYAPVGQWLVNATEWLGLLFLALIKMVVVPLVFCSLIVGVASLGDFRKLGRLGGRTILFFTTTTVLALVIGVGLANIIQPGNMLSEDDRMVLLSSYSGAASDKVADAAEAPGFVDQMIAIVPDNPFEALSEGNMMQIIFFALALGIALTFLVPKEAQQLVTVFARINDAMVMLVHLIMKMAPYGVGALLFKVAGSTGPTVLLALAAYGLVVLAGLAIHLFLTYGLVIRFGAKLPFFGFLGAIREALLLAFSTSSSSATLPVTMQCVEEKVGVGKEVSSFVLPLGATVNMDGTALYQGVAAIFIAQIYGMDLGVAEQATIVGSATLASIGAAGVPGAGMITLAMVLTAIGVPAEGLALVLGVDRLLDMFRTATNVVGDSTATTLMARLEGEDLQLLSPDQDAASADRGFEGRLEGGQNPITDPEDQDS
ncbi:MAG: dicarboxylate/amino acid:cation symporter [Myxococcota bacterium]|nr:dicarboxylate/amino acid:cation symporter [Myxococcota bacterium]